MIRLNSFTKENLSIFVKILARGAGDRGPLFLRIPNYDGEHPLWNVFAFAEHVHLRSYRAGQAVSRDRDDALHKEEGGLGAVLDRQWCCYLRRTGCRLRGRRRNLLQRCICLNLLVEETGAHARPHLQQWTDLKGRRNAYGFCMFNVPSSHQ